jgi:rare lipoprotein A
MALALGLAAVGCATDRGGQRLGSVTPNPHEKVGNPYRIGGQTYVPRHDPTYVEEGIASWYGPNFHGKLTANGELFDMDRLTAAHKTLPLPSLVRVTNLENGRQVIVRLNDRGPFAGDRIIDLSRRTAEKLGTREQGLARVRVEYIGPARLDDAIVALGEPEDYRALEPRIALAAATPRPTPVPPTRKPIVEVTATPAVLAVDARPAMPELAAHTRMSDPGPIEITYASARSYDPAPIAWFVQVGVFKEIENAATAAARLPRAIPVSTQAVGAQADLYRLRLGPYPDEFAAFEAESVAQNLGFEDAHVVQDVLAR